jgi:hypothetical protein
MSEPLEWDIDYRPAAKKKGPHRGGKAGRDGRFVGIYVFNMVPSCIGNAHHAGGFGVDAERHSGPSPGDGKRRGGSIIGVRRLILINTV